MRISDWSSDVALPIFWVLQLAVKNEFAAAISIFVAGRLGAVWAFNRQARRGGLTPSKDSFPTIRIARSDESRVGSGCFSTCRFRWEPNHEKETSIKRACVREVGRVSELVYQNV